MPTSFDDPKPDSHAGLLYESGAPVGLADGKISDAKKRDWLDGIASIRIPEGYADWFKHQWHKRLSQSCHIAECETTTRLLVGSGIASATDVGLHLHHTWGVPMVPGSSIKGVLSHYLHAVYGPDPEHDAVSPQDPAHPQPDRAPFRRPRLSAKKGDLPPGQWQQIICGTAEYPDSGVRAAAGHVVFYDMLMIPPADGTSRMLAVDVLTPHNNGYMMEGKAANDYEDPEPVPFLSVPPGVKFLLAVGGDRAWAKFAADRLREAVADWGLGAKTAAGYGRLDPQETRAPKAVSAASRGLKDEIEEWVSRHAPGEAPLDAWQSFVGRFCETFGERLAAIADTDERRKTRQPMNSLIAKAKTPDDKPLSRKQKETLQESVNRL